MIWPKRPGSWNYGAKKAREAFKRVAWAIAESEEVFMLAEPDVEENAREMIAACEAVEGNKFGQYMLDKELAARVYSVPSPLAAKA